MIQKKITDPVLLNHLNSIERDGMTVFIMADGQFRGAFYNGTEMVNQMRANHNLGILETLVLGQAELCAALLIPTMKGREHVTFRYDTNGPAAGFSVEADSSGYVRGFLFQDPIPVTAPLENWDLSPFFGEGTVTVTRLREGMKSPQTGTVEIQYRNIARDLTWYFAQSEQIHTAFHTSIQFDKTGRVTGAGGLFLQAVPASGGNSTVSAQTDNTVDTNEDLLMRVENALRAAPSPGTWFSEGGNREDVIYGLFREFSPEAVLDRDILFNCPCSREHFSQSIRHLPKKEFENILADGKDAVEVVCHNCGSVYQIQKTELQSDSGLPDEK